MAPSSPPDGYGWSPSGSDRQRLARRVFVIALAVTLLLAGGAAVFFVVDRAGTSPQAPTPDAAPTSATTTEPTPDGTPAPEPEPPVGASEPGAILQDVTYCTNDGVDLQLDFFHAPVADATPLVVFVHGGGWTSGNKGQLRQLDAFDTLLESGYSFASVNYRLAPDYQFPAPVIDVKCAVRHLRANATSYGIDPERIGVAGFSAGAHMALLTGVTDSTAGFDVGQYDGVSSAVGAVVDMNGPADMAQLGEFNPAVVRNAFAESAEVLTQASPIAHLDSDDPPVLILHGDADTTVPVEQAIVLDERLTEFGIEHTTTIIPGGVHRLPVGPTYTTAMLDFLDRHLA